jgi:membrane-bound lytic murein transglycosylase B
VIERYPRLGFAVLGLVLIALGGLGALIIKAGGGASIPGDLTYRSAPAPVQVVALQTVPAQSLSRSAERKVTGPPRVDPVWAARTGAAVGIPAPAMAAYGSAQLVLDKEQPGCHLSWNTLAGIGWIESQNGTIGGRTLLADGFSSRPIIGPALDGTRFAAIRSTPMSATWHGDATWEHAVGPMQFIASTWAKWGADGDNDGIKNPLDINDAALTTARYLCADDHDLATAVGWNAAVHSAAVLNAANTYAVRAK